MPVTSEQNINHRTWHVCGRLLSDWLLTGYPPERDALLENYYAPGAFPIQAEA